MKTMKTALSAIFVSIILMSCGSGDKQGQADKQAEGNQQAQAGIKFILKASNSQYITINSDQVLVANEPITTKAEVFEKIDLGNGKCAIKTSNGKFVSADRSNFAKLTANRDNCGEWETFEIIAIDKASINIKTSEGKYVTSDRGKGDILMGDRPNAGDWETFVLEQQ